MPVLLILLTHIPPTPLCSSLCPQSSQPFAYVSLSQLFLRQRYRKPLCLVIKGNDNSNIFAVPSTCPDIPFNFWNHLDRYVIQVNSRHLQASPLRHGEVEQLAQVNTTQWCSRWEENSGFMIYRPAIAPSSYSTLSILKFLTFLYLFGLFSSTANSTW